MKRFLLIGLVLIIFFGIFSVSYAEEPVVRAVLFYSPTCGHCHYVMTEILPPLVEQYDTQLEIIAVDVTSEDGHALFVDAIESYDIPPEKAGSVPTLIVGEDVLVGSGEIPDLFPGIIEKGLEQGGIGWPHIPLLLAALEAQGLLDDSQSGEAQTPESSAVAEDIQQATGNKPGMVELFQRDIVGNSISVAVLLGLIVSLIIVGWRYFKSETVFQPWPDWIIILIIVVGLAVAGYMSYVEVNQVDAVCGPVGDCDAVQQSQYAWLFGVLPMGVFGLIGYLVMLVTWLMWKNGNSTLKKPAAMLFFAFAVFGTVFSIYLTFLEPFVIGATCAWCLTSAVLMVLLLWAAVPITKQYPLEIRKEPE